MKKVFKFCKKTVELKKVFIVAVSIGLCIVLCTTIGLTSAFKKKVDNSFSQVYQVRQMTQQVINDFKNENLQQYEEYELTSEQQAIVDNANSIFDEFYQAFENNASTRRLYETLNQSIYNFSIYLNQMIGETVAPTVRGTIRIILTAGLQSAVLSAITVGLVAGSAFGSSLAWAVSVCVSWLLGLFLPVALVPIVGQIIMGALAAVGAFLAGYLLDKWISNNLGLSDITWKVASGWLVPNWDLRI